MPPKRPAFPRDPGFRMAKPTPRVAEPAKARPKPRAISPAHSSQREKVRDASSIISGERPCDAAHVLSRAQGGCDSPDCVIPLTRQEHVLFDQGKLDVLGEMIARDMWVELSHPILEHHVDPIALVHRLTGERYIPERVQPDEREAA